jgi:hypothetical protein
VRQKTEKAGFVKDNETNTIINSNLAAYLQNKKIRNRILQEIEENKKLQTRMNSLEDKLNKLLESIK